MPVSKLIAYAKRNGLGQPGFTPKTAKFALSCDASSDETPSMDSFTVFEIGNVKEKKILECRLPFVPKHMV